MVISNKHNRSNRSVVCALGFKQNAKKKIIMRPNHIGPLSQSILLSNDPANPNKLFRTALSAFNDRDFSGAFTAWSLLAEQNNPDALNNLGLLHSRGLGVTPNYEQAVNCFKTASFSGHALAQNNLGIMNYYGFGTQRSYELAHMWFNISASNGNELGGSNIDIVAKKMSSADISKAQSMARQCMASNYQISLMPLSTDRTKP